jgi:hypothetical protein
VNRISATQRKLRFRWSLGLPKDRERRLGSVRQDPEAVENFQLRAGGIEKEIGDPGQRRLVCESNSPRPVTGQEGIVGSADLNPARVVRNGLLQTLFGRIQPLSCRIQSDADSS